MANNNKAGMNQFSFCECNHQRRAHRPHGGGCKDVDCGCTAFKLRPPAPDLSQQVKQNNEETT